jgi:tetratricopeptide (TPR) repeat protein
MQEIRSKAWFSKGFCLENLDRHHEAIVCYDKALQIDPRFEGAWFAKGGVLFHLDKIQEAIACYDKALEINPREEKT